MRWRRRRELSDDEAFREAVHDAATAVSSGVLRYDGEEVTLSGLRLAGVVDLTNVRQVCAQQPREVWASIVLEHFAGLADALENPTDITDLAAIRPLLRSRLYAESDHLLTDVTGRVVAPGLLEALVVRRGPAIVTVPPEVADRWGPPLPELYELGRRQVLAEGLFARSRVDVGATDLVAVESESHFTATHVFWLRSYIDVPAAGALVAVPNRHLLVTHPIAGRDDALTAAQALLLNAQRFFEAGPGSLSPHLYWWRDGTLALLPAVVDGDRITFRPPPEFVTLLDTLPG